MRYYLIAGEASGDLHGSNLMRELKSTDPDARFRYFGGDLMLAEGGTLVKHYREMAFMGILNVVLHIKTIGLNMNFCQKDIVPLLCLVDQFKDGFQVFSVYPFTEYVSLMSHEDVSIPSGACFRFLGLMRRIKPLRP